MAYDSSNIFARILRGEIPCKSVYEDDHVLAFHDIQPKAPIHILVIPKGAYIDLVDFYSRASSEEITAFCRAVAEICQKSGLVEKGFRAIANSGVNGGQEVPHYHIHLMGGKALGRMLPDA